MRHRHARAHLRIAPDRRLDGAARRRVALHEGDVGQEAGRRWGLRFRPYRDRIAASGNSNLDARQSAHAGLNFCA